MPIILAQNYGNFNLFRANEIFLLFYVKKRFRGIYKESNMCYNYKCRQDMGH